MDSAELRPGQNDSDVNLISIEDLARAKRWLAAQPRRSSPPPAAANDRARSAGSVASTGRTHS